MLYLVSVICGEMDNKSYTPLRVFKSSDIADAFIVAERKRFDRMVSLYELSLRLISDYVLAHPPADYSSYANTEEGYAAYTSACNKYNAQLLEETNRIYMLLGYDPKAFPNYAVNGYVFRKDSIPCS